MARVPTYDNLQVSPNSLPTQGIRPVQAPVAPEMQTPVKNLLSPVSMVEAPRQMPDIVGRTMQQQGEQMSAAGRAIAGFAIQAQSDLNKTRVIEAKQAAEKAAMTLRFDPNEGYLSLKGKSAMERPGQMNMADEYMDKLSKNLEQIGGSLGNDAQKQAFNEYSGALLNQFYGQAQSHMVSEATTYQISVYKGQADLATNQLSMDATGPDSDRYKQEIRDSHYAIARLSGKSDKEADAAAQESISKASRVAVTAMVEQGNYGGADQYLQQHKDDFRGDDALALRKIINQQQITANVEDVSNMVVMQGQPVKGDFGRLVNLARGQESGGKQIGADGKVLTSRKGALGVMQVMPGTGPEAAKLAGEEWSLERLKTDAAYNERLGTAYLRKQLSTYGGDERKALAAYNAGPGAVDKAMAAAEKKGGDFLQYLPAETQKYVAAIYGKYSQGEGAVREASLSDMQSQAKAEYLQRNPNATQEELDKVESRVNHKYTVAQHERTQEENAAVEQAYDFGSQNGWDWSKLPQSVKDALPADKRLTLERQYASAGAVKTDEVFFAEFKAMSTQEKANLQFRDFKAAYHDKLSENDMGTALGMIANARNENPTSAADQSAAEYIKKGAISGGILPANGKLDKGDTDGAVRFSRYHDEVVARIRQEEQANGGRKLPPEKVEALAKKVALEKVSVSRIGFDRKDQVYSSLSPEERDKAYTTMKALDGGEVEVPVKHNEMLTKYLQQKNLAVNEANMATLYKRMQKAGIVN